MLKKCCFFLNTDANCDIYLLFTVNENNLNATKVNCAYINMCVIYNFFFNFIVLCSTTFQTKYIFIDINKNGYKTLIIFKEKQFH